jgi:hypothetical protein
MNIQSALKYLLKWEDKVGDLKQRGVGKHN